MKKMTDRQKSVYDFIKDSSAEMGFPPTVREIAHHFEITAKGAYDHVKAIEKKGYIQIGKNKSRSIVIVPHMDEDAQVVEHPHLGDFIRVPILGSISACQPILAEENFEDWLTLSLDSLGSGEFFALVVRGDSMIDGGIFDGDTAVIKLQNEAKNGDIIAALVDGDATLKKLESSSSKAKLVPMNSSYNDILDEFSIMGILKTVIRHY